MAKPPRANGMAGGHPPAVDARGEDILTALVRAGNDRTLEELATLYKSETSARLSRTALWRTLKRLGLARKKVCEPS